MPTGKLPPVLDPTVQYPGREWYGDRWVTPQQKAKRIAGAGGKQNALAAEANEERKAERQRRAIERLNAAVQVDEQGAATEDEQRVRWVWKHLFDVPMPKAPDKETATLLKMALLDSKGWMDRYVAPLLTKQRREEADIEGERQDREASKLAKLVLLRHKFDPCPACQGSGERNPKYVYYAGLLTDRSKQ